MFWYFLCLLMVIVAERSKSRYTSAEIQNTNTNTDPMRTGLFLRIYKEFLVSLTDFVNPPEITMPALSSMV